MKKAATSLFLALVLQGCFHSHSPSRSDVEAAVLEHYARLHLQECRGISIENVRSESKRRLRHGYYEVVASYDVRIIPLPDQQDAVSNLQSRRLALEASLERLDDEMRMLDQQLWEEMRPEQAPDSMKSLIANKLETTRSLTAVKAELHGKLSTLQAAWGSDYCVLAAGNGLRTGLLGFQNVSAAMVNGEVRRLSRSLRMIQTQIGWVELNLSHQAESLRYFNTSHP